MRLAEAADELAQANIGHHRHVRTGVPGIDLCAPRAFEQGHRAPRSAEQIGRRQARDAAADDDDIDVEIAVDLGKGWE
jgi:hypothetical protein